MIFPFLNGILDFRRAPVTWLLVLMNLTVFVFSSGISGGTEKKFTEMIYEDEFLITQGRLYAEFLASDDGRNLSGRSELVQQLVAGAREGDNRRAKNLGYMATRDQDFFVWMEMVELKGDQVAVEIWREGWKELHQLKERHPSFLLGLGSERMQLPQWISYMFAHGSMVHFLGNMLFLLIFGCMLEPLLGGLVLLLIYLAAGLGGGLLYVLVDGPSLSPLVGASGAISGLVGLFCVLYWSQPVRYIYWLFLPVKGYLGFVYLPAWVVLFIWLVSDLAGIWSGVKELGGVAYTAHLGGQLVGLAFGLAILLLRRSFQVEGVQSKLAR